VEIDPKHRLEQFCCARNEDPGLVGDVGLGGRWWRFEACTVSMSVKWTCSHEAFCVMF
jgi:hypothetical protein